ncbi:membrane cofactor protein isoform X3 [Bombina bombina]|uniref:membrane cofactor protein isoform X3 n=1 Tax=Bombina bombina TaxID=8345 RepID=UPI00235AF393|nr:membrane cofactor protein isoform X3 [Bombina bombina]
MMKIPKTNERNLYMSAIFCLTLLGITTAYRVNCPEPKIFNGKITMKTTSFSEDELETGYKVMDTVKVACNSFYNVKGSNTIVCGNDLKWHPAIPICQGWFDCPYPAIDNGHIVLKNKEEYIPEHVGHGFTWKNTVQLQCDSGFVMQGEDSSVCTFLRKWSPELPKCVPSQTTTTETTAPRGLSESEHLAAIIVPCVLGGRLLIGLLILIFLKIREARQTEETSGPDLHLRCL